MPRRAVMPKALARLSQGDAFCARDFEDVTTPANAKNLLARYANDGLLERLLPGVYCLTPAGDAVFKAELSANSKDEAPGVPASADGTEDAPATRGKSSQIYPSTEDVARTVARLRGWTIAPAGRMALAELGILPIRNGDLTYVSTGSTLSYDYLGATISFIHGRTRELIGLGETTRLVVQALRAARNADSRREGETGRTRGEAAEPSSPVSEGLDGPIDTLPSMDSVLGSIARTFSTYQIDELLKDSPQLARWLQDAIRKIVRMREDAVSTARSVLEGAGGRGRQRGKHDEPSSARSEKGKGGARQSGGVGNVPSLYRLDPSLLESAARTLRNSIAHTVDFRSIQEALRGANALLSQTLDVDSSLKSAQDAVAQALGATNPDAIRNATRNISDTGPIGDAATSNGSLTERNTLPRRFEKDDRS